MIRNKDLHQKAPHLRSDIGDEGLTGLQNFAIACAEVSIFPGEGFAGLQNSLADGYSPRTLITVSRSITSCGTIIFGSKALGSLSWRIRRAAACLASS